MTVNHEILIKKLLKYTFSTRVIKWIKSYLTDRQQCVRVDNKISQSLTNSVGVPQGSILGPLLFSLYINYLPDVCAPAVNCQMYADDTIIYLDAKTKNMRHMNYQQKWLRLLIG